MAQAPHPLDRMQVAVSPHEQSGGFTVSPTAALLTDSERLAASLDAAGTLRTAEVARAAGMTHAQYRSSRQTRAYQDYVREILQDAAAGARAAAVATRAGRIGEAQRRHDLLMEVVEQRGAASDPRYCNPDPEYIRRQGFDPDAAYAAFPGLGDLYDPTNPACQMVEISTFLVPGAATGLLVKQQKSIGSGPSATLVDEWSLDTGLLSQLSAHEKQAAQDAGQWADRTITQSTVRKLYVGININEDV